MRLYGLGFRGLGFGVRPGLCEGITREDGEENGNDVETGIIRWFVGVKIS